MERLPTLRQLEYLVAIVESGNFRRAATRLGVSQPTLTSQIATLERTLGLPLLERSRSGSRPTPAGRTLEAHARRVLEETRALMEHADLVRHGPAGTYRLGVTPTLGPYLLPVVLPGIHQRHGDLKFYVREDAPRQLEQDLLAGVHDVIMTPLPIAAGDLRVVPLFREPLQLVLSAEHALAAKERIEFDDLRGEAVLTLEEHHLFHQQISRLCERLGAHVLRDYEGTSLDTLRHMVVMGMGIAFLPALYVRSEIHQPDELRVMRVDGEVMERIHALAWRPASPLASLFERLAQDLRELVGRHLADVVQVVPAS